MTLFNVQNDGRRAVVASDSRACELTADGRVTGDFNMSKLIALPHLHAVFVARGHDAVVRSAQRWLLNRHDDEDDEDDVLAGLALLLGRLLARETVERAPPPGMAADAAAALGTTNAALVAYDHARGRIRAFGYFDPDGKPWGHELAPGPIMATWDRIEDQARAQALGGGEPTREDAAELARLQFESVRGLEGFGFGGHLLVAEIDERGIGLERRRHFFDQPAAEREPAGGRHLTATEIGERP